MIIERIRRSVAKAVSWRVLATLTTMAIVFVVTGKLDLALIAGGLDIVLKMILYFIHERIWNRVHWGKKQLKPFVLWFTGLSGSGKSTLADAVSKELLKKNINFEKLDGDALRDVFPKTGFSKEDRNMHIRRAGFLAGMLEKRGVSVVSSFISPYKEARKFVRENTRYFVEVHVSTSLEVCEKRDPKGLYKKARSGEIKQFTGIDDPYEPPENPELRINTANQSVEACTQEVIAYLKKRGFVY